MISCQFIQTVNLPFLVLHLHVHHHSLGTSPKIHTHPSIAQGVLLRNLTYTLFICTGNRPFPHLPCYIKQLKATSSYPEVGIPSKSVGRNRCHTALIVLMSNSLSMLRTFQSVFSVTVLCFAHITTPEIIACCNCLMLVQALLIAQKEQSSRPAFFTFKSLLIILSFKSWYVYTGRMMKSC